MNQDVEAAALIAEIGREASGERESILSEARARAREILADVERRAQQAAEEAARIMEKQARVDEDRLLGRARMEADAERTAGVRSVYQRVFEIAEERLAALVGSPRYSDVLKALLGEAMQRIPKPGRVCVSRADAEVCRKALREMGTECTLTEDDLPRGSVVVFDAGGTVKVDNSLRVRLAMALQVLETPVAKCLNE
ncbi:MAG: V-type ATP synthase subunit E [Spirochaetia bacterium]